jgi:hypothetical protein
MLATAKPRWHLASILHTHKVPLDTYPKIVYFMLSQEVLPRIKEMLLVPELGSLRLAMPTTPAAGQHVMSQISRSAGRRGIVLHGNDPIIDTCTAQQEFLVHITAVLQGIAVQKNIAVRIGCVAKEGGGVAAPIKPFSV